MATINACMWTNVTGITWMITIIALRSTLVPDTAPACSSFAVRNAPGSKRRRFASAMEIGPDIGPYQTEKGCSEWPVLNVRADINALILRGRCGRPMCETQGGGGQNVGANRSSARSRSNLAANEPIFTSGSLHLGRYPNGERSRPPWWGSRCRGTTRCAPHNSRFEHARCKTSSFA